MSENPENNPSDRPYASAVNAALVETFENAAKMIGMYYSALLARGIPKELARDITLQFTDKVHDKMNT